MKTDSMFVPPDKNQEPVEFFQPLNPYNLDIPRLKPEKENLWFYEISCQARVFETSMSSSSLSVALHRSWISVF